MTVNLDIPFHSYSFSVLKRIDLKILCKLLLYRFTLQCNQIVWTARCSLLQRHPTLRGVRLLRLYSLSLSVSVCVCVCVSLSLSIYIYIYICMYVRVKLLLPVLAIVLGVSCLNKLDAVTKGTTRFSNPQVLSSALAVLEKLQPCAFGLLNCLVPQVLAFNYYIASYDKSNFLADKWNGDHEGYLSKCFKDMLQTGYDQIQKKE